jgi:DNA-binding NarL/FixJ family response regulator
MNGLDLTRQLLRMGLRVPVVIVSVDAEKLHDAAIDAGAVCAIPKLAARSRLLDAVSAILQCKPS